MKPTVNMRPFWNYFILNSRSFLLYYVYISIGLLFVFGGLGYALTYSSPELVEDFFKGSFWAYVNICGFIVSTSAFSIYSKKNSRVQLLMLPVSNRMRFATLLLFCIPLFFIYILLYYSILGNAIEHVLYSLNYIKPFSLNVFKLDCKVNNMTFFQHLYVFILLQSVFLMIGSFFPSMGLIKSVVICIGFLILFALLGALLPGSPLNSDFINGFFTTLTYNKYPQANLRELMPVTVFIWRFIWALIIPLTWYISYLQVKELEG